MEKGLNLLKSEITSIADIFIEKSKNKEIYVVGHFDTDGITSTTILIKTLKRLDKIFTVKIIKNLEEQFIENLPKDKLILFLDLASGSLEILGKKEHKDIFIIDHHEIDVEIPENIRIINPQLFHGEKISSSGLAYLFCKCLDPSAKELAKFAILGMIGDTLEKEIDNLNNGILNDSEIVTKRGLLIYPSTRPLNRSLEYSSNPYIPGITGNVKGVLELLREVGLKPQNGKYKSLIELNDEEMSKLVTAIMLRVPKSRSKNEGIVGDIFFDKNI